MDRRALRCWDLVASLRRSLQSWRWHPRALGAEPLCTDTWVGPAEANWDIAADWSTGEVPSSTDVACIGSGKTVFVTTASQQTGVLNDEGVLRVSNGSLEIANAIEVSSVHTLRMNGGTLTGSGTLRITSTFEWNNESTMSGSGSTVLESGASGAIEDPGIERTFALAQRSLVNEGTLTLGARAELRESEGAEIENVGTFIAAGGEIVTGSGAVPLFANKATFEKTKPGAVRINVSFRNEGTVQVQAGELYLEAGGSSSGASWDAAEGAHLAFQAGAFSLSGGSWSGTLRVGGEVTAEGVGGEGAHVSAFGTLTIGSGSMSVASLELSGGTLNGAGTLNIAGTLNWINESTMSGSGSTVLETGASGTIEDPGIERTFTIAHRSFVNKGTIAVGSQADLMESEGATLENVGTWTENGLSIGVGSGAAPLFVNTGTFQKTGGSATTRVEVDFENLGTIRETSGRFEFQHPVVPESSTRWGGAENPSSPGHPHSTCGDPVDCATGNDTETQTDLAVGGRGVGLDLTRTYNSQAGAAGEHGAFGYGWTSSFSDSLTVEKTAKTAVVHQANGSTVPFTETGEGTFVAPARTQDTLSGSSEAGYILTLADQIKYKFAGSNGRLESVTDRDGNATTLGYSGAGRLETITDPVTRKIKLAYNGEGLVESAEDPMGHVVKYTYEGGNLKSVTQPAEAGLRWQFKYDGSHQMTEVIDGRSGKTVNEYNGSHQVALQEGPAGHKLKFTYEGFHTKITNETTGSITSEYFTSNDEPSSITRGYGTGSATTESFTYNEGGYVTSVTNGNGHTTKYGYSGANDRTSMVDPVEHETKWTYDGAHDVLTMTTPRGEKTTIERDAHGNPEKISRPAPGSTTQTTKYKYTAHGELDSVTDPLEHTWKYDYDADGDRTSETDPEGDKRTWEYNEDSQEIATVSPRGNVEGVEAAKYTTATERDVQGRPLKVTDPLGHTTKYVYDGDGNVETTTDANTHKTTYTYNADNQPTKVKEPNGTVTETEYDGAGRVISQTDGNKHETKYVRNVIGEVTEVVDPLGRKTTKEYDKAGNLTSLTDPAKRTATYKYDAANRLKEITYSDGKTPTVKYTYDEDGDRTSMTDGTGTTTYGYDQLDRLTESKDGHGDIAGYVYNLANEQTKITYPNGKTVEHAYDKAGRLEKITDWLEHTTKFAYDPDSDLTTTAFPSGTGEEDEYVYNEADQMSETAMKKGGETLASLVYKRDNVGQLTKITSKELPGAEVTSYAYDENNRLTEAGANAYEYDAANNPTKTPGSTNVYDEANELEKSTGVTYAYDELGERTKTTPSSGPATSYGYDEAEDLTSVKRPEEGAIPAIEDIYAYDGNGLRASQTIGGITHYLTWDMTGELPLILSDGQNSYIYGPGNVPIEQISSGGEVLFLHHDQQGSTRMLTDTGGTVKATMTYDAYGNLAGHTGGSTTALGYDGQYTNQDTGLIYMRAREYDPATGQFLSLDPLQAITGQPYNFVTDNPLNETDPTGLIFGIPGTPSTSEVVKTISHVASGAAVVASVTAAGCAVAAAPTVVGEAVCGVVGTGALAAGTVATAADAYLAEAGVQSPGPAIFDALGLGTGFGGEMFEGALGDAELGAYAKTYGVLLSAAAYGEAFAESAFGCD
jgi:RHS repeat-associated protein